MVSERLVELNLFTFITKNSADYADFNHKYCEKLKSWKHNINYYCIESVNNDKLPVNWECLERVDVEHWHNCLNHAEAMHRALKHCREYNVFIDADVCILHKNWDEVILNKLQKYDVWGTAFDDNAKQYNRFPNVFLFCFRGQQNWDFNPILQKPNESPIRLKLDACDCKKFGKTKDNNLLKCDTGVLLPDYANEHGLTSGCIKPCEFNNRQLPYLDLSMYNKCKEKPTHMAEWHYKGKVFCTHKQASRNHPLNGEWGDIWKRRIEKYVQ